MNCEEFESIGLGLEREGAALTEADAAEHAAALAHANACQRCAALQRTWSAAQVELRALQLATQHAAAPLRVEMRLLQEFRRRHRTSRARTTAVFAAWTLATAAVLLSAIGWWNWRMTQRNATALIASSSGNAPKENTGTSPGPGLHTVVPPNNPAGRSAERKPMTIANNDRGDFTLLPGSLPEETDDAAVVRVRLQRGALGALGLPVNAERAGEWLQVDLLVGEDGQPRAVRLPNGTSR